LNSETHWSHAPTPIAARVEAWLAGSEVGASETMRDDDRRIVARLAQRPGHDETALVVKRFRRRDDRRAAMGRVRRGVGLSAAEAEWRALGALHRAGVSVPEPLAMGRIARGDELVVMTALDGQPLIEALSQLRGKPRRRLLERVGEVVAEMHSAGYRHGDLHPGNVVVTPDGPRLIDFQRSRRRRGSAGLFADLGQLDFALARGGASRADRVRLRRAALSGRGGGSERADRRAGESAVAEASRRFALDHYRGRTRRCLMPGRRFRALRLGGASRELVGLRLASCPDDTVEELLREHRRAVSEGGDELLKEKGETRITIHPADGQRIVVKSFRAGGLRRAIADSFRGSGARRAWIGGHGLSIRGIGAAIPLAFAERRTFGLPTSSWVLLTAVGSDDLGDLAGEPRTGAAPPADDAPDPALPDSTRAPAAGLAWLGDALLSLVIALHSRGAIHRDLKAGNLRVARDGALAGLFLIDLEDVRFPRAIRDRERRRALIQLNASIRESALPAVERERVFARYCERLPFRDGRARERERILSGSLERRHVWRGGDCAERPPSTAD